MPQQIIIQTAVGGKLVVVDGTPLEPGKFAIWSTITDDLVAFNGDEEGVVEWFLNQAKNEITRKVKATLHELKTGEKPYAQFTMDFEEAVAFATKMHGEKHFQFKEQEKQDG